MILGGLYSNTPEFHPMPELSLPNCLMGSKAILPGRSPSHHIYNTILIKDSGEGNVLTHTFFKSETHD